MPGLKSGLERDGEGSDSVGGAIMSEVVGLLLCLATRLAATGCVFSGFRLFAGSVGVVCKTFAGF